ALARRAQTLLPDLVALEAQVRQPGDARRLLALWAKSGAALSGFVEGWPIRQAVDLWGPRVEVVDELLAMVNRKDAAEQAIVNAWTKLQAVGTHPDVTDPVRRRVELAERRSPLLAKLRGIADQLCPVLDKQFTDLWDEALL